MYVNKHKIPVKRTENVDQQIQENTENLLRMDT